MQEYQHDDEDENNRFDKCLDHFLDGQANKRRRVIRINDLHSGRECFLKTGNSRLHAFRGADRIGAGGKIDADGARRHAVIAGLARIAFRSKLHTGYIVQPHQRTVGRALQNDVAELLRRLKAALGRHRRIELLAFFSRHRTELPRRNLCVLRLDGRGNIARHERVFGKLVRIQPDAHGIASTENAGIANAFDAFQRIVERAVDIISQVVRRQLFVRRDKADDHQKAFGRLAHRDPGALHDLRQLRLDELQLVLHLHLRHIRIGRAGEGQRDRCGPGRGRVGRHVIQIIDTGHALFDHLGNRVFDSFGIRTRIGGADAHRGWCDLRILRDGQ